MELITINEITAVIRLVPNGITEEGRFRFSIVLAIDSINDHYKQLSFKCLMQVASKIDTLIKPENFDSNFGIYFKSETEPPVELEKTNPSLKGSCFDLLNHGEKWQKFFSNPENKIIINKFKVSEDFTNPDNAFEFVYNDVKCCDPCGDDDYRIPECDTRDDLLNRIDLVDRNLDKVEAFYDNAYKYKTERIDVLSDGKTFLFSDILSQIYQHPKLNNDIYGIKLNFEATLENIDRYKNKVGDLILTKRDCSNTFLKSEIPDEDENGTLLYNDKEECILSIYDNYIINRVDVIGQLHSKYYHGRSDYGLINLDEKFYEWKYLSKVQDWNNQLATANEGLDKNNAEKVEGIILYHNLSKKTYEEIFHEIGIDGHEILCQIGDEKDGYLGSLCEREAIYELSSNPTNKVPHKERSSIKIDTAVIMNNQLDLKNNEIFKWEGYNLCLPKSGIQITGNTNTTNDLDNINNYTRDHDQFEVFFENYGFTYSHKFVNDSNIYLKDLSHVTNQEKKEYIFYILKCDAVTGYRIPVGNLKEQNDSPILDLATLIKEKLLIDSLTIPFKDPDSNSNTFSITPKNSPLYPVHILDRIEHSAKNPEDIEKNNRLILNKKNIGNEPQRFIIPDSISYHFGQLIGLTDNSFIQASDRNDYLKKAYTIYKRAQVKIPKVYFEDTINYLPDVRNTHIIIRPDDWKSWMKIRNIYNYEIKKQLFFYENSFEEYFDDLAPYPIKMMSSGSTLPDSLELYFYQGINCKIPMYSTLNLRLYSATKNNSDYFKSYSEISFINVQDSLQEHVEKPAISECFQPITAQRCLPDKSNNTFTFFTFKVKEDLRRDYLTLLTQSRELIDDGHSSPVLNTLLETDLANEYSREIFNTVIGNLKTNESKEVFPNKFGLSYEFNRDFETKVRNQLNTLNSERKFFTLFKLSISSEFSLELYLKKFKEGDRFYYRKHLKIKNGQDELYNKDWWNNNAIFIIDYTYSLEGLHCTISYETTNDNNTDKKTLVGPFLISQKSLPFINMDEDHISMGKEVEEVLINKIKSKENSPNDINFSLAFNKFENHNNWYRKIKNKKAEYFVYRNEEDNKFKELTFKLKSYSKFKKYYPKTKDYPWCKFSSIGDSEYTAIILNNKKPTTPVFNFTPLFYKIDDGSEKTTENPICIRVNRPQSEDLIGIVDAEYDTKLNEFVTTQNTSSFARDITKSIAGKPEDDNTLSNYLQIMSPLFMNTYYKGKTKLNINGGIFRIILFKPDYNAKEKQYQFIIPVNYNKFDKLDDPIVKIVLTRVQEQSITYKGNNNPDTFKTSLFSNAKFIPIRSQRIVSVNKITNTKHEVTIKKNGNITNIDTKNSAFIIGYFTPSQKGFNELVRELIPVKKESSGTIVNYILIDKHTLKEKYIIEAADSSIDIGSIGIFEIEKHNNNEKIISDLDNGIVDFMNHPQLRIIYTEEFYLPKNTSEK